jgi:D-glycerate 3-kinase
MNLKSELQNLYLTTPSILKGIESFYLPITEWVENLILQTPSRQCPCLIGINGPQGSGKSTLVRVLSQALLQKNFRSAFVSIDDFYLTYAEQKTLAELNPKDPYLQQRGYPGTHDVSLGHQVLTELKSINRTSNLPVRVPRYDKSKNNGRGDRLPQSEWTQLHPFLDVVFLEGWMLGFKQVPETQLLDSDLFEVNSLLPPYETWIKDLDAFLQLAPSSLDHIVDWRVEAEENMKSAGKSGMTREEVTAYIKKFIPAYQTYLPGLLANPPITQSYLRFNIGKNRLPGEQFETLRS